MTTMAATSGTVLIAGASRGLGRALALEFARRGCAVIATERSAGDLRRGGEEGQAHERIEVERLDVTSPDSVAALSSRLQGRRLDVLFVNAGTTTHDENVSFSDVNTAEFERVLATNTLGPMRVIEALERFVGPEGLIGAMSSGQGSITNNVSGGRGVYRASKAALNMSMRTFAARPGQERRALLLLAPGWIRTDLGGDKATFTMEESVPKLADVIDDKRRRPGLEYLDRDGRTVPW